MAPPQRTVGIRRAQPGDELSVARVHVRAWQAAYRGLLPDLYLDGLLAADRAARYTFGDVDPRSPATLVAVEENQILAFVTVGPCRDADTPGAGELLSLNVDPQRWGTGVGRSLVAAGRQRLAVQHHDLAILWMMEGNARAGRFYAQDGWLPDGAQRTETVWGAAVAELRLRRPLP